MRAATVDDAARVGEVHVRAWEAYRGLLPDDFLDNFDPVARGERWGKRLAEGQAPNLLVAERDGVILGICDYGPSRDSPDGHTGEIWMINVVPEAWGTGVGQPLFDAAVERLRGGGFDDAVLWVLEGNARGRRFYERNGWRLDGGAKDEKFGDLDAHELRYRIVLSRPNS